MIERKDANAQFYGIQVRMLVVAGRTDCQITAAVLLGSVMRLQLWVADRSSGKIPAPEAASSLYSVVEAAEQVDESNLPSQSASTRASALTSPGYVPPPVAQASDKPIFDSEAH